MATPGFTGAFWAGFLYEQGEYKTAAQQYQRMLSQVGDNPVQRAQLSLGLGVSLANGGGDKAAALMELLADTLPYGSAAQRCEAQYWAGRLLVEEGQASLENENARISDFAKVQIERGKVLLAAAAEFDLRPSNQATCRSAFGHPEPEEEAAEPAAEGPLKRPPNQQPLNKFSCRDLLKKPSSFSTMAFLMALSGVA